MSPEDVEKCTERFSKAKAVNSILRHVADILKFENEQLEDLYQKTAWHFEEKYKNKAAAYDVFKQCVIDPSLLDECQLEERTKDVLLNNIKRKLTSQAVKIRADIECACYEYEGIDAVKTALRAGLELSTEELPIKINLIAPPLYVMTTSTPEKADGLKALEVAIEKIRETIAGLGGVFNVQMAPKVVTAIDEADLARRMERAEMENTEVAGDEDEEDEEGITADVDGVDDKEENGSEGEEEE